MKVSVCSEIPWGTCFDLELEQDFGKIKMENLLLFWPVMIEVFAILLTSMTIPCHFKPGPVEFPELKKSLSCLLAVTPAYGVWGDSKIWNILHISIKIIVMLLRWGALVLLEVFSVWSGRWIPGSQWEDGFSILFWSNIKGWVMVPILEAGGKAKGDLEHRLCWGPVEITWDLLWYIPWDLILIFK